MTDSKGIRFNCVSPDIQAGEIFTAKLESPYEDSGTEKVLCEALKPISYGTWFQLDLNKSGDTFMKCWDALVALEQSGAIRILRPTKEVYVSAG